jgi:hypothetical protein
LQTKTYLALFDILGFKEIVSSYSIDRVSNLYNNLLIKSDPYVTTDNVKSMLISDTIILYHSDPTDNVAPTEIIVTSSNILNYFARNGIALRGALSFGELFINESDKIIIGKPLVRAYEFEKKQNWAGAIIDPNCESEYFNSYFYKAQIGTGNVIKYPAPLKDGMRKDYQCIEWVHRHSYSLDLLHKLFFKNADEISHSVYVKYRNTLDFIVYCKNNEKDKY